MTVALFADLRRRPNFPVVFRREGDDGNEADVVVLRANGNSKPRRVLDDSERDFSEAQRNRRLGHFLADVVGGEAYHRAGVESVGSAEDNRA